MFYCARNGEKMQTVCWIFLLFSRYKIVFGWKLKLVLVQSYMVPTMDSEQADSLNQIDFKQVQANCKEKTLIFPGLPNI